MTGYEDYFKPFPAFQSARLLLRALKMSDAADLYACCRDPEVSRYSEWYPHPDLAHSKAYIAWMLSEYRRKEGTTFAVCLRPSGRLIGTCSYIDLDLEHKTSELGYCLGREYWGHGYGAEAAFILLDHGFRRMGLHRMDAKVMPENARSARVLEKLGMEREGLLHNAIYCKGGDHDLELYAVTDERFRQLFGR